MAVTFITGPVSCGKSALGVRLARESGREVTYVATAAGEPEDAQWRVRLSRHVRDRPDSWRTIETATMTADAQLRFFRDAPPDACLLVDSLGTWLAARMASRIELLEIDYAVLAAQLEQEANEFAEALLTSPADVIVVSEQIGWDLVPPEASARLFRDVMGRAVQRLAHDARHAYLVVAGYALDLRARAEAKPDSA
ncbi:MAG: bifunctional adenosylcobinamide kinase/adenosylcobinamide-phosphate guanylyltransferase [Candidatus Eremiobacteraeota bacterium]|nr:bifunctional adenosylcobinamide kinase/adenosylcobinamide-phosphate guanylyltransferase [Candidatus Eremiobacteraeota bacterium]MBV9056140.1 bifunctional adenosylcobinamide kinase/adenosylcobinamide-phosphate guanylyltransferase [Candidatus Eremiobacteraeota bacterium]MBV9700526.1 bifunctional adenosylcobinamide kinase/adenosylcobinamide-phosphate guanylyltransferase [Candidatus Eremiobacteraeota bacterium]